MDPTYPTVAIVTLTMIWLMLYRRWKKSHHPGTRSEMRRVAEQLRNKKGE